MSEDRKKKQFIQEHIRKKPLYKQKGFQKVIGILVITSVFGSSAGLVFSIVFPMAMNHFGGPTRMVVIGETETETETESQRTAADTEVSQTEESLLDYHQQLYAELADTGEQAVSSMVVVTGLKNEADLFNNLEESEAKTAGVIIAEEKSAFLILAYGNVLQEAGEIKVTFFDGTIADAKVRSVDSITDLAILKVDYEDISEDTRSEIGPAVFGTSEKVEIGDSIVAVGVDYMSFGMVTSRPSLDLYDGSYRQIKTDIIGRPENGGVLVNLEGQVVGVLLPDSKEETRAETLDGFGIVEILELVESLSNNEKMAYFGIVGKEVTDALAEEFSMPKGVYVTQVADASPAMKKGVQATDISSSMNGHPVSDMKDYMEILQNLEPGDKISMTLWRKVFEGYKETTIEVTLSER